MKTNKNTPRAKVSQSKKAGKTDKSSLPDTHAPQDRAQQSVSLAPEEIAARAYLRYQSRAAADGDHLEDWFHAEAELAAERHQA